MLGYRQTMNDAADTPFGEAMLETRLRQALAQGDGVLAAAPAVLRHLLADEDSGLFGDAVLARVRGMAGGLASQLIQSLDPAEPAPDEACRSLATGLAASPALLGHLHALALEWELAQSLDDGLGLDPVLSPLLQALIGSADETTAALAMKLLAAQARFGQGQRRMHLPLAELPGDLLHAALMALRTHAGADPARDAAARTAEAAIRRDYDEGTSRLGLLSRLATSMGAGAVAALSLPHAGAAIFLSTLAIATAQDRDFLVLAASERQNPARLALTLGAAGLKPAAIAEQLITLYPHGELPAGFSDLAPDRAAALLAEGA